jgi:IPT/TIG domain
MATGCLDGQQIPDAYEKDKLNLVKRGLYYGAPNLKRGAKDDRQCVWRAASLPGTDTYTAPMMRLASSTTGIIEYDANHFNGQLRGNLILSKYKGEMFRVILTPDGTAVEKGSNPAISIGGEEGLALAQAPDGSIVDARHGKSESYVFKPNDVVGVVLAIKAVFPRRGALVGGSTLAVYGNNFKAPTSVKVGSGDCTDVVVVSATKLTCQLPPGTLGLKDITVTVQGASDTFTKGYRYITGKPV